MVEPTCDRCGRELSRMDRQYVAVMQIRPTIGAAEAEEDPGDRDYLLEIDEMLEGAADEQPVEDFEPQEFLICHQCCCQLREDPLPRETALHVGFSEN